MDKITETLLKLVSDYTEDGYKGAAFNIRENGGCAGRQSTENIKIEPKEDKIIWTFPSKEAADNGEKVFNRSGFKYMKRR